MAVDLTNDALTNLATLKDELGIAVATYDDTLNRLINAVSRRIRSYCGRIFYFEEDIVEAIAGFGGTDLILARHPLVSITSITYDGVEVDSSEYSIANAKAGIVYRANGWAWTARTQGNVSGDPLPGTEEKLFEATYNGGYVTPHQVDDDAALTRTLPEDLEDACLIAITSRYSGKGSDKSVISEKSLSYAITYAKNAGDLPEAVKEMLGPYREVW